MHAKVIVASGASAGKELVLEAGRCATVGRVEQADLIIRDDPLLSNLHFSLEWDGTTCRLRDLQTRFGTTVNQTKIADTVVRDGDQIKAGQTMFALKLPTVGQAELAQVVAAAPVAPARISTPTARPADKPVELLTYLRQQPDPLYAILDGARDPLIYVQLLQSPEQYQSLYEGPKGEALAPQGPFLVSLAKDTPFLEALLRDGWGHSWGIFLTSDQPFAQVRRHFRRFLLVKLPDGKEVFFRFYDPRVLRVFLPTCQAEEWRDFVGPVSRYLMEADKPEFLLAFNTQEEPNPERVAVVR